MKNKKEDVKKLYPYLVTDHFLKLAKTLPGNDNPIYRQVEPSEEELKDVEGYRSDPLCESKSSPLGYLIHRYRDRVLVLCTNRCFIHCRFCFRKYIWKNNAKKWGIGEEELAKIATYIKSNSFIKEVILSGGDPFTLTNQKIIKLVKFFDAIEQLNVIRIGTRVLSAEPRRIDKKLIEKLSETSKKIWFMSHFNHPVEISDDAKAVVELLLKSAIPIFNQTVLLKGVNDDVEVLEQLFRQLVEIKVKPHYLFGLDPAEGNAHFACEIRKVLEIFCELRKRLSSLALPQLSFEQPCGGGKFTISPELFADLDQAESFVRLKLASRR